MKKSITLLAGLGFGVFCTPDICAQDTLHFWNMFDQADRMIYGNSDQTFAPNVTPGTSGLGQTWTFTTTSFDYMETMNVSSLNWLPSQYTDAFAQSTFAFSYGSSLTAFDFGHINGDGLFLDGSASLDPNFGVMPRPFSDPLQYLKWRMYYGVGFADTATANWKYATTGQFDSAWEVSTIETTVIVDGQGTLITSYGTYDILRIRRDIDYWTQFATHDPNTGWSTFSPLNFTTTVYEWWTDSIHIGWMVAQVQVNPSNGAVLGYKILTDYTVGLTEHAPLSGVSLYPNPATDVIFISGDIHSRWEIRDAGGNFVSSGMLRNKTEEIDIAALASGVYLIVIVNGKGEPATGKFVHYAR
jgi:hypothetical protein